jgi:NAD(P)-dependent dehydrogenase (short-subunit alcohol dehydrogenase family)
MSSLLKNKIILITGGAQGIGLECVKEYVKQGAFVSVLDKNRIMLDEILNKIGSNHLGICCDVSKSSEVENAIQKTLTHFGKLDAIHNNAGIANPSKALHETSEIEWDEVMNINLKSIFLTTKYGLDALKKSSGCILNTSSMVAEIGQQNHAAYAGTKGAINSLTKSMALDYASFGIRVNAVAPAGVWTPMLRQWNSEQEYPDKMKIYLEEIHVLGYCPNGDVVADVCTFLISDMARFVTGCIMPVTGGAELGYRIVQKESLVTENVSL